MLQCTVTVILTTPLYTLNGIYKSKCNVEVERCQRVTSISCLVVVLLALAVFSLQEGNQYMDTPSRLVRMCGNIISVYMYVHKYTTLTSHTHTHTHTG